MPPIEIPDGEDCTRKMGSTFEKCTEDKYTVCVAGSGGGEGRRGEESF
jgi:hypothetical protein